MAGIASKLADVFLDPLECLSLILESIVQAQGLVVCNLLPSKEPVRSDPVVEVDDNYVIVGGIDKVCAIVIRVAIDIEASSLDEDVDGEVARIGGFGR
jgi:hypothetical protein